MHKLPIFLLIILLRVTSYSQDKVFVYKSKADKVIANYFDRNLIPYIKCTDVVIYGKEGNVLYYSDYGHAKNRSVKLSAIEFDYSFFSKVLNYKFKFSINVRSNKKVQKDSLLFSDIPSCVAKKLACNILTKDSAIRLAIKDSISYPKNLHAEIYKNYKSGDYFWFVTGSPNTKKTTKRTTTKRSSTRNKKIINAQTGEVIPYDEYFKD